MVSSRGSRVSSLCRLLAALEKCSAHHATYDLPKLTRLGEWREMFDDFYVFEPRKANFTSPESG